MADLVEKLRSTAGPHVGPLPVLLHEAADEIDALRSMIGTLLTEPSRSVKLISKKIDQFEPMTMTVTKGQVLEALRLIRP